MGGTSGYYPEVGWRGSSGGFSDYFARPSYQDHAVSTYLDNVSSEDPNSGRYNASGRAIPVIAVKADNYTVAAAGGVLWLLGRVRGQVALALLLGCTTLTALPPLLRPARELVFLDVGQGDATLIRARRFNMLVDGGGREGGLEVRHAM